MAKSTGYQRPVKTAARPCETCRRRFHGQWVTASQKYCSLRCSVTGRLRKRRRKCIGCGVPKPLSAYKLMPSGRTRKCDACWQPRKGRTAKRVLEAPKPCAYCHKRIRRTGQPYSRVKALKYCDHDCQSAAQRTTHRRCSSCRVVQPRSAFSYAYDRRSRTELCQGCAYQREDARRVAAGYMVGVGHARAYACRLAKIENVPMALGLDEMAALHGKPCVFCGKPGCVFYRSVPELGFVAGNVAAVCSLCFRWAKLRKSWLTTDEMLAQAQRIVAYLT